MEGEKNPGMLVKTMSGNIGRTYNNKGTVRGKIPVYLSIDKVTEDKIFSVPMIFSEEGLLCTPDTLKCLGYID